jgi:hypothetical protein
MNVDPSYTAIEPSPPTSSHPDAYKNLSRRVMSRKSPQTIGLVGSIKPGAVTEGCLVCCYAPSFCPLCSILPVRISKFLKFYIFCIVKFFKFLNTQVLRRCGIYSSQALGIIIHSYSGEFNRVEWANRRNEARSLLWIRSLWVWRSRQRKVRRTLAKSCSHSFIHILHPASVLYFDDKMFERISDQTRCCNECRTCLFGGKGDLHTLNPFHFHRK